MKYKLKFSNDEWVLTSSLGIICYSIIAIFNHVLVITIPFWFLVMFEIEKGD